MTSNTTSTIEIQCVSGILVLLVPHENIELKSIVNVQVSLSTATSLHYIRKDERSVTLRVFFLPSLSSLFAAIKSTIFTLHRHYLPIRCAVHLFLNSDMTFNRSPPITHSGNVHSLTH